MQFGVTLETKVIPEYHTSALGFPIIIRNLVKVKILGEWCPEINWKLLSQIAITALMTKPSRLIGGEIKFIRTYFSMSLRDFGAMIQVSAAAVKKWEDKALEATDMHAPTEKMIRLHILNQCFVSQDPLTLKNFRLHFEKIINQQYGNNFEPFSLDYSELNAA